MMFEVDGVRTSLLGESAPTFDARRSRRPGRLGAVVLEALAHAVISGALAEGAVLPREPTLCEQFGFSRTVIREGLKLLEERGLVRVEQGRGTTVQPRDSWNLLDPIVIRIALEDDADMSLLDDLIAVRRVLEREMARVAASRITADELAALEQNIRQMESSYDDYSRFRAADLAFHAIVMKASGNEVGLAVVRTIHTHAGITAPLAGASPRAALERTAAEHRAIFDALAVSDGERAGNRIAAHIDFAWAERRRTKAGT
jgi:DNA-binding FadR family transcriptional regulator